jgi:hypothetical protein
VTVKVDGESVWGVYIGQSLNYQRHPMFHRHGDLDRNCTITTPDGDQFPTWSVARAAGIDDRSDECTWEYRSACGRLVINRYGPGRQHSGATVLNLRHALLFGVPCSVCFPNGIDWPQTIDDLVEMVPDGAHVEEVGDERELVVWTGLRIDPDDKRGKRLAEIS